MTPRFVACTKCQASLPPALYNAPELRACPSCGAWLQVEVFPAALRPPGPGAVGEAVMVEGEASCFYHPAKKAVVPCESCGRFLCAICDVDMNGRHLCPACLESGKKKGKLKQLENRRTLYDSLALAVAVYPVIFAPVTLIGAPVALYIAIRYWNAPNSIVPRSRWRAVLAIIIALLEMAAWAAIFVGAASLRTTSSLNHGPRSQSLSETHRRRIAPDGFWSQRHAVALMAWFGSLAGRGLHRGHRGIPPLLLPRHRGHHHPPHALPPGLELDPGVRSCC